MELKEMALAIMENCKKYSQPYAYTHDCIVPECMLHARCVFNHRQGPSGWAKCRLIPNVFGRYMDHPDMPKNWKIEPMDTSEAGEQQETAQACKSETTPAITH